MLNKYEDSTSSLQRGPYDNKGLPLRPAFPLGPLSSQARLPLRSAFPCLSTSLMVVFSPLFKQSFLLLSRLASSALLSIPATKYFVPSLSLLSSLTPMSGQVVDPPSLSAKTSEFAYFLLSSFAPGLSSALVTLSNLFVKPPPLLTIQATDIFAPSSGPAWLSAFLASNPIGTLVIVYSSVVIPSLLFIECVDNAFAESNSNTRSNLSSLDDEIGSNLNNDVRARLDKKVRSALYNKAIRVIEN